jgi:hypothetical protein
VIQFIRHHQSIDSFQRALVIAFDLTGAMVMGSSAAWLQMNDGPVFSAGPAFGGVGEAKTE